MKKTKIMVGMTIDETLWLLAKKKCVDKGLKYSEYVGNLLEKDLRGKNESDKTLSKMH